MTITSFEELQKKAEQMKRELTVALPNGEEATILIKKLNAMDILTLPDFPSQLLQEVLEGLEEVEPEEKGKKAGKKTGKKEKISDAELFDKLKPVVEALFKNVMLAPTVEEISEFGLGELFPFSVKLQIFKAIFEEQSKLIPSN